MSNAYKKKKVHIVYTKRRVYAGLLCSEKAYLVQIITVVESGEGEKNASDKLRTAKWACVRSLRVVVLNFFSLDLTPPVPLEPKFVFAI